jgi:toxin ParE1/3/4
MTTRLHPEAQKELNECALYYEDKSAGLGLRFVLEFEEAIRQIESYPLAGREVTQGIRRVLLETFEHGIVYFANKERVEVLAIAHSKRKPNYWAKRK